MEFLRVLVPDILSSILVVIIRRNRSDDCGIGLHSLIFLRCKGYFATITYADNRALQIISIDFDIGITQPAQGIFSGVSVGIAFADLDNCVLRHNFTKERITCAGITSVMANLQDSG